MDVTLLVEALAPPLTGIGRYTLELSRLLPLQPGIGRVRYYLNGELLEHTDRVLAGQRLPVRRRVSRWMNRRLARNRLRSGVVHGPNFFIPEEVATGVITVHDLSVFRYPETHPPDRVQAFERDFESSLRRAAHVITDSETVRGELIADFGVAPSCITPIHLGVSDEFRTRGSLELDQQLVRFGLHSGKYALCVSTFEPRKKIGELIGGWSRLPPTLRDSVPLVLAGATGWRNDQLHAQIAAGMSAGWLKHLGYVPDHILAPLYSGASLFIYPSTYEGFGLPPLEAMASGVPVLVANRSCLPEVCGDAAGYIDPDDETGFSEAIVRALTDEQWQARARQRGLEHAAAFTWDRCVAATVSVYRSVFR